MARKKKSKKQRSSKGKSVQGKSAGGKSAEEKPKATPAAVEGADESPAEAIEGTRTSDPENVRDSEGAGDPEAEDVAVVLDDDPADSDDLDALIAATVAGAALEDHVEEVPVQSLEAHPEDEVSEDPPADAGVHPPDTTSQGDLADTIDLGDVSSHEVRDRLLAQALAHAEMQDARYRVPLTDPGPAGRWKAAAAAVLFLAAAMVGVAPPRWVRPEPPVAIEATARTLGIRQALLLQAQQVDAYRVRTQRLPEALEELPARLPGIRYVRSGNRSFQLVAYERSGDAIVYDSASPAPEFAGLPAWRGGIPR